MNVSLWPAGLLELLVGGFIPAVNTTHTHTDIHTHTLIGTRAHAILGNAKLHGQGEGMRSPAGEQEGTMQEGLK